MVNDRTSHLDTGSARRVSAVVFVRDALRRAILRGDIPGGSKLIQTDLARQFGVSTTPVREAMRDLANGGFIVLDSYKVGTVRTPSWAEIEEIVQIRQSLEHMTLALVMPNVDDDFLDAAHVVAAQLSEEADLGTWVQTNTRFHSMFHRRTKTTHLASMLTALEEAGGIFVAQAQRLHPEIRRRAIADHFELIDAFRHSDLDRAIEIQHRHIQLPLEAAAPDGLEERGMKPGRPLGQDQVPFTNVNESSDA